MRNEWKERINLGIGRFMSDTNQRTTERSYDVRRTYIRETFRSTAISFFLEVWNLFLSLSFLLSVWHSPSVLCSRSWDIWNQRSNKRTAHRLTLCLRLKCLSGWTINTCEIFGCFQFETPISGTLYMWDHLRWALYMVCKATQLRLYMGKPVRLKGKPVAQLTIPLFVQELSS